MRRGVICGGWGGGGALGEAGGRGRCICRIFSRAPPGTCACACAAAPGLLHRPGPATYRAISHRGPRDMIAGTPEQSTARFVRGAWHVARGPVAVPAPPTPGAPKVKDWARLRAEPGGTCRRLALTTTIHVHQAHQLLRVHVLERRENPVPVPSPWSRPLRGRHLPLSCLHAFKASGQAFFTTVHFQQAAA
jgi:hypothetical protein